MHRKRWSSVLAALGAASGAGIVVGVTLARIAHAAFVLRLLAVETAENERRIARELAAAR